MKLVTFSTPGLPPRVGVLEEDGVHDLAALAEARGAPLAHRTLKELLETEGAGIEAANEAVTWGRAQIPALPLDSVRLHAPVARPGKLLCSAGNYQKHYAESNEPLVDKFTAVPRLFLKPSSSVIGPGEPIWLPEISNAVDWEVELAAVIGRRGFAIAEAQALDYVAGYTVINDISARALVSDARRVPVAGDEFFDWLIGKFPNSFAPLGPCLLTSNAVPDPQNMPLRLTVNDVVRQEATTQDMIYSVAELIAYSSRFVTLEPGDIIATGTPHGVGAASQTYLSEGDQVSASIEGIGRLDNPVQKRRAAGPAA